jgi:hypothetical protein
MLISKSEQEWDEIGNLNAKEQSQYRNLFQLRPFHQIYHSEYTMKSRIEWPHQRQSERSTTIMDLYGRLMSEDWRLISRNLLRCKKLKNESLKLHILIVRWKCHSGNLWVEKHISREDEQRKSLRRQSNASSCKGLHCFFRPVVIKKESPNSSRMSVKICD